jgi:hypothetical protein
VPSEIDQLLEDYGSPVLDDGFGVSVILKRRTKLSVAFTATWQDMQYQVVDEDGMQTIISARVWVFEVGAAVIDGSAVEPRAGDRIVEGSQEFDIAQVADQPAVQLMPGDFRYRVHSNRVV